MFSKLSFSQLSFSHVLPVSRTVKGTAAVLLLGCWVSLAEPPKKSSPAPAPSRPAPSGGAAKAGGGAPGAHPANANASHGPTTSGSHGPTTSGASHGPTTAGAHGPTTAGGHSPTAGGTAHTTTPNPHSVTAGGATHPGGAGAGHAVPAGNKVVKGPGGNEVRMRPNGRPGDVHVAGRNMDIHHNLAGGRRVEVERADHTRIVAERGRPGYVQHPYRYGGHEYVSRTYVYHGVVYNHYYVGYPYRGLYLNVYSPPVYYARGFYGWAYNPWAAPVAYSWGWGGNPWYGYYGFYFNPYPVYPSASAWLVDYMVSQSLMAAYQARAEANAEAAQAAADNAAAAGAVAMSAAVKDMISAEVQRQIALENQESQTAQAANGIDPASSGLQRMLTDGVQHVFVAGSPLDLTDASNNECAITEGDALQLSGQTAPDATAATLVVLSSKGGQECRTGTTVAVQLTDLQEMQNHMRETIDKGMGELQAKQSKGGLPALPVSATAPPTKAPAAAAAPPPDPSAATEIAQQTKDADQAEKQVLTQVQQPADTTTVAAADAPPAPAAPPGVVSMGQTIDQVTAIEGAPKKIVNLGAKKIYVFADMKVTFKDGKVSDVE